MNRNRSRTLQNLVLVLVVSGVLLLALAGYLTPLTRIILAPFVSVQTWLSESYQAFNQFLTAPRDTAELRQQNAELEAEVSRLQGQLIELQQQIVEVQVLSELLDFARANPQNEYLAAAVIGRDTNPFLHYVIINRGSDDGLRRGMPVVTQQGLVGRVTALTAQAARVQLITDPAVSINIRLKNADAEAVLSGSITADLTVNLIPQDAAVEVGDLVLTSGLGGNFPPNITIGQVTGVRRREFELFQESSVQSVVDFSRLEIVLIITNFQPVDVSPLIPTPLPANP